MLARLAAGAGALALAVALAWMHGNARFAAGELAERAVWLEGSVKSERELAAREVSAERRAANAAASFADQLVRIEPIVLRSSDTVTRYAQTPAGAVACLGADRVHGIEADAAALGLVPANPASGGDAVHADPDPGGR